MIFYLLFRFRFPKSAFHNKDFAFRFLPCFVVGIPVARANFDLADDIPSARFQLNPLISPMTLILLDSYIITGSCFVY